MSGRYRRGVTFRALGVTAVAREVTSPEREFRGGRSILGSLQDPMARARRRMGTGGEGRGLDVRNPCSLSGVLFAAGDAGLRKAASDLHANAARCPQACGAAYFRSRKYALPRWLRRS
jgi:hypothetical protein